MVLVDTSIWVDYFNGLDKPTTARLDRYLGATIVAVGDLILAEVLQGFRRDADHRTASKLLLDLDVHELGGIRRARQAAANFRSLRRLGVTVRGTVDCFIATYCIEQRMPLLYGDRDFDPFRTHLGLIAA